MVTNPIDPAHLARIVVEEMIREGSKKHDIASWRKEPASMHLGKGARHGMTALLQEDHPEYTRLYPEDKILQIKQAITRYTMALAILLD